MKLSSRPLYSEAGDTNFVPAQRPPPMLQPLVTSPTFREPVTTTAPSVAQNIEPEVPQRLEVSHTVTSSVPSTSTSSNVELSRIAADLGHLVDVLRDKDTKKSELSPKTSHKSQKRKARRRKHRSRSNSSSSSSESSGDDDGGRKSKSKTKRGRSKATPSVNSQQTPSNFSDLVRALSQVIPHHVPSPIMQPPVIVNIPSHRAPPDWGQSSYGMYLCCMV